MITLLQNVVDVLSIGANAIALNSGFITEKATEKFVLEAGTNDGSADEFIELEGDTVWSYNARTKYIFLQLLTPRNTAVLRLLYLRNRSIINIL